MQTYLPDYFLPDIIATVGFGIIAILLIIVGYIAFDKLTPKLDFDDLLNKGNIALAIVIGSFMLGLCHGKPIVTTFGELSEPFWRNTDAVAMSEAGDDRAFLEHVRRLETDADERARIGRAARALYQERFDMSYTIEALRQAVGAFDASPCAS